MSALQIAPQLAGPTSNGLPHRGLWPYLL